MHAVVLPVLNEREALPWVLERMPAGYEPIVVDNGSTDGSGALARRARRPGGASSRGRASGPRASPGSAAARADVVCFMDCDASFDPRDLPRVAEPVAAGDADLVLGARGRTGSLHGRLANRALAFELRRRCGVRLTDLGPMRAARREPLLALGLRDRRFGWPLEMVVRAAAAGWDDPGGPGAAICRARAARR